MTTKRIRTIRADPEFIETMENLKKEIVVNLNIPLNSRNLTKIISYKLKNDGKKLLIKKKKDQGVVEII